MDIKFTEVNPQEDTFSTNYWEVPQQDPNIVKNKKKVSFGDILNNMNLVVNDKGVLQYMVPLNENGPNGPNESKETKKINIHPIEKNGYIYNKYFKDYRSIEEPPAVRVPKSMQEYKQMLLEDKIKNLKEKKRISEIKSTKLLLTNTGPLYVSKNALNKMNFY